MTDTPENSRAVENRARHDRDVAAFSVLGISVEGGSDWLGGIEQKLGAAKRVARGNAAAGREQLCYRSLDGQVNLTFEEGELESAYYLFTDGKKWNGEEYCAKSQKITDALTTRGGLRLGLSEPEVEKILGRPTHVEHNNLIYEFRSSGEHEDWVFGEILLSFSHHRVTYLGILRSEVN